MWNVQASTLFFLFALIIFTGIEARSNSSKTDDSNFRLARDTNANVVLSTPEECFRPCDGGPPRYCYYKFRLDYHMTMGPACNQCRTNSFERSKNQSTCQCILADGFEKTIFSINRQFPGPSIQVCLHDKVIVDVHNAAEGTDTTMHWHGIFQKGSQYYDGVPHVTQCPISAPNTFRYQFTANNPGTHFYHSHSSLFLIDGQQGPLIVRQPRQDDPNSYLYQYDLFDHVIFISDWLHTTSTERYPGPYTLHPGQHPTNILLNGLGNYTDPVTKKNYGISLAYYQGQPDRIYRMRMVNSFGTICPVEFSIENHQLTVIATDGEPVKPVTVDKIISVSGERYDFVLKMKGDRPSYWIQVRATGECLPSKLSQLAVLVVGNQIVLPSTPKPTFDRPLPGTIEVNSLNASHCMDDKPTNQICINQLEYALETPRTEKQSVNIRAFMPFRFYTFLEQVFKTTVQDPYYVAVDRAITLTMVSNISYAEASSPLISQEDALQEICSAERVSTCTQPCLCTHVFHIPLNSLVEILLCDEDPFLGLHHPFHMHGYSFQVMAIRDFGGRKPTRNEILQFIREHDNNIANGRYRNKPRKDTIKIPMGGCAIIRFYAHNPGWWLFHCHFLWHTISGMNVVLHVGEQSDLPSVPDGFPVCGNYIPSVYV